MLVKGGDSSKQHPGTDATSVRPRLHTWKVKANAQLTTCKIAVRAAGVETQS
jgi:hypothetical protein